MTTEALRTAVSSWPRAETRLLWSLRASFTEYVRSIDDSRVMTDGVTIDEQSRFVFRGVRDDDPGVLAFGGAIHFWAHLGVLDFRLADLRIHLIDAPRITIAAQPRERNRATIAELVGLEQVSDSTFAGGATLTDDGVRLLGGVYSIGTPLDTIRIVRVPPSAR